MIVKSKLSLLQTILAFPLDLYYKAYEDINDFLLSVSDQPQFAIGISLFLHGLLLVSVHVEGLSRLYEYLMFGEDFSGIIGGGSVDEQGEEEWESIITGGPGKGYSGNGIGIGIGIGLVNVRFILGLVCCLACILNFMWMAWRTRKYRLFNTRDDFRPKSPNAKPIPINRNGKEHNSNYESFETETPSSLSLSLIDRFMPKIFIAFYRLFTASQSTEIHISSDPQRSSSTNCKEMKGYADVAMEDIRSSLETPETIRNHMVFSPSSTTKPSVWWELSVWEPFNFCITFFCLFNPFHVIVILLLQSSNPLLVMIINAASSGQTWWLIQKYTELMADRQIHFEQVYHEYNVKFVNRRLFVRKHDIGIGTERSKKE